MEKFTNLRAVLSRRAKVLRKSLKNCQFCGKVIRDGISFAAVAAVSQGPAKTFETGSLSAAKQHLPWRLFG